MIEYALDYAARGWPVMPLHSWTGSACTCGRSNCSSPAKHPRTQNGLKNATTDEAQIRTWWEKWPEANVGLRTGDVFDVLDVDGDEGWESLQPYFEKHGPLPDGPVVATGGDGWHFLFLPTGENNKAGFLPKVDWRGQQGYVVAAESLHSSGKHYAWAKDSGPELVLPAVPQWLVDLIAPPRRERPPTEIRRTINAKGESEYGRRALEAELEELSRAAVGTRNHSLNVAAFNLFQLVAGGELDEQATWRGLMDTALGIGLGESEAKATIASGRKGGFAHPRSAPELRVIGATALKVERHTEAAPPQCETKREASTLHLPETFWDERPALGHIHKAARSRLVSPDALLGAVLVRIVAMVPHTIELPGVVGSPVGLTLFVILNGPPEAGKSAAAAVAGELLPAPREVLDRLPVGSGEGFVECMFEMVTEEDDNGKPIKVKRQTKHAAIFHIDEGAVLSDIGTRSGATLLPTLRTAWTHGTLGNTNASAERRRILDGHQYIYGVTLGIQPELAGPLLADVAAGTPQRFVWLMATDPAADGAVVEWPGGLPWEPPSKGDMVRFETSRGGWRRHHLSITETIAAEIRADRLDAMRGQSEREALDAHRTLGRLKVAAALALMDQRLDVSDDDWRLAGVIAETSRAVRRAVEHQVAVARTQQERAAAERHSRREMHVVKTKEEHALDKASRAVARVVRRHRKEHDGCIRSCLTRAIAGRDRDLVSIDDVISQAEANDWITAVDDKWKPGSEGVGQ